MRVWEFNSQGHVDVGNFGKLLERMSPLHLFILLHYFIDFSLLCSVRNNLSDSLFNSGRSFPAFLTV